MANIFESVTKYTTILDRIMLEGTVTSILNADPTTLQMVKGTNEVKYPKMDMDGLGEYDRETGYDVGSATLEFQTHVIEFDRSKKFSVDVIDDDETAFIAYRNLSSEFLRTKVVPEIDAVRFSKIVSEITDRSIDPTSQIIEADLTATTALSAFDDAEEYFSNVEAGGMSGTVMFVSTEYYKALKQSDKIERRIDVGNANTGGVNRTVDLLDGTTPIIKVPKNRFYDAITLTGNGYLPTSGGAEINFMIVKIGTPKGLVKHVAPKVILPGVNQTKDAYEFMYRIHHDLIALDNQVPGLYVHVKATKLP